MDEYNSSFITTLLKDETYPNNRILEVVEKPNGRSYDYSQKVEKDISAKTEIYTLVKEDKDFPKEETPTVLANVKARNVELAKVLISDKTFPRDKIAVVLNRIYNGNDANSKIELYNLNSKLV